jgi:hypothetical protein
MDMSSALLTLCSGIVGVVVGATLTAWLTYGYQKKLLRQQLDFLTQQAAADAALRKIIHAETIDALKEIRHQIHIELEAARVSPPEQ